MALYNLATIQDKILLYRAFDAGEHSLKTELNKKPGKI